MPELVAEGWINGEAPTSESLAGKVVVLEAWGPACSVCWKIAPQLDQIYEQYHDQGVEFVGLTAQGRFFLDDINRFIDENRIRWLNGYGAEETFEQLGVDSLPAIWIVGADGRIVWNHESSEDFTTALDKALARAAGGGA
jgi:thiol-disulfide isomerase/thioredoxin